VQRDFAVETLSRVSHPTAVGERLSLFWP